MSTASRRAVAAFTLLEIIVALALLSGGILSVMEVFSRCTQTASVGRASDAALDVAMSQLALATHRPAEQLTDAAGEDGVHQWTVSIREVSGQLRSATVHVEYLQQGQPQRLTLSKLFIPPTQVEDER